MMNMFKSSVAAVSVAFGALLTGPASAAVVTLNTTSTQYLGYFAPGEPASATQEAANINTLTGLAAGTASTSGAFFFSRSSNSCVGPCETAVTTGTLKDDSPDVTGSLDLGSGGWTYLLGKYDGPNGGSLVWDVSGLTGDVKILADWGPSNKAYGLSHWSLYNYDDGTSGQCGGPGQPPCLNVPEPGTLAIVGLGLIGVGIMRRRRQQQQA
jgi:PEP-CTERM motif